MDAITGTPTEVQQARLMLHASASAIALTNHNDVTALDLDGEPRQPSPGAQREMVAEKLARTMGHLERVIRAQTETPPVSVATLGRKLVQRGESLDLRGGSYRPGPGLATLIDTALIDAAVEVAQTN